MEFAQEEYKLVSEAVVRARWLLFASVLVAAVALTHLYIEQFSMQEGQLAIYEVMSSVEDERLHEWEKQIKNLDRLRQRIANGAACTISPRDPHYVPGVAACVAGVVVLERLDAYIAANKLEYGRAAYMRKVTTNTLANIKTAERELPLVKFPVPANDFLPLLAMLLALLNVALWMTCRSVQGGVKVFCKDQMGEEPARVAGLLYRACTITGVERALPAQIVRFVMFVAPGVSLAVAAFIDLLPVLTDGIAGSAGKSALLARIATLFICIGVVAIASFFSFLSVRQIDRLIDDLAAKAAPPSPVAPEAQPKSGDALEPAQG